MATSIAHKYIQRIEQRENNLFLEEYYSSTDTRIYFDDKEQTEIGYIGYSLQEQLKPLYGYSSYTYDDMAVGNRIVTGTFKVPIKNPEGHLGLDEVKNIIMTEYKNDNDEYNQSQEALLLNTDWVDNTTPASSVGENRVYDDYSDSDYVYIDRLGRIGYGVDTNSNEAAIRAAIKAFQRDYGIVDGDGKLTSQTKSKINEEFESSHETINLSAGMVIYDGPNEVDYNVIETIKNTQRATVQSKYTDGWMCVSSESGVKGYVRV